MLKLSQEKREFKAGQITDMFNPSIHLHGNNDSWIIHVGKQAIEVSQKWIAKHRPQIGGYVIEYSRNRYASYSPVFVLKDKDRKK